MKLFRRGRKESRAVAKRLIPLLPRFLGLLVRLVTDRRVRFLDKALVFGVVGYILMPVDLIPDLLGVLGWTDDLFLLGLALRRLVVSADEAVVRENWRGEAHSLDQLEEGLDDLGTLLPAPVQRVLERFAERW